MAIGIGTFASAAGSILLGASLLLNGLQYRQHRVLLHENATLAAHVDVLKAARSADDRTHHELDRLRETANAKAENRRELLREAPEGSGGGSGSGDDDALLDYLRGLFTNR